MSKVYKIGNRIKNLWNRDNKKPTSFSLQFKFKVLFKYFKLKRNKNLAFFGNFIKDKVYQTTGFHLYEISNAFATSSLILIFIKIASSLIFNMQISFTYNLSLLLVFFGVSLIYNIHFYIRFLTYKIIKNTLGEYFFGADGCNWKSLRNEIDDNWRYIPRYQNDVENGPITYWPKRTWHNDFFVFSCTLLIQIRLFMMAEPYLFIFIRFLLFYWLLFNKFLILTYIISLIILFSRFLLLYQDNDFPSFRKCIEDLLLIKEKETIKPTYKNSFFVLSAITRNIIIEKKEFECFYITKRDPQNNFTKKYEKDRYTSTNGMDVYWKLTNYYLDMDDFNEQFHLQKTKKNEYLFTFIVFFIYLLFLYLNYTNCVKNEDTNNFIDLFGYLLFRLPKEHMKEFYHLLGYKNLYTNHPGLFIINLEEKNTVNVGSILMSNLTTLKDFKPNLLINSIDNTEQYGYVRCMPKGHINEKSYNFLKTHGVEVSNTSYDFSLIKVFDAYSINQLLELPRFSKIFTKRLVRISEPFSISELYHNSSILPFHPNFNFEKHYAIYQKVLDELLFNILRNKKLKPIETNYFQNEKLFHDELKHERYT